MALRSFLLAAAFASRALAQTWTDFNPTNTTCPPDLALGTYAEFNWTANHINPNVWNATSTPVAFGKNGSEFTVDKQGDSPTINTRFYIFGGTASVLMRAAPGTGIVSSIVLISDDLDELDWEILGGNRTMVQSNYFGKGNSSSFDRAVYHNVPFAPQDDFHNYTFDWNKDRVQWIIDGKVIRELKYREALGGANYPQTPMKLSLGSWAGGDSRNPKGTIDWAGGLTDFKKGPYSMQIKTIYIQDASNASQYIWTDKSGSWESIKAVPGQSSIIPELSRRFGYKAHWNNLSQAARIAIVVGSISGLFLVIALITWFCIRSTRKGLREHAKAEAEWEAQRREAESYRQRFREQQRASSFGSGTSRAWSHNEMTK